jgi:hypothetical protein
LRYPQAVFNQWGIMQSMLRTSPLDSTFSIIFHIFCISGSSFIGVIGIILLVRHRKAHHHQNLMTGPGAILSNEPIEDRTGD